MVQWRMIDKTGKLNDDFLTEMSLKVGDEIFFFAIFFDWQAVICVFVY
jgi:hypothetical protein